MSKRKASILSLGIQKLCTTSSGTIDILASNFYSPLERLTDFHIDFCDFYLKMSQPNAKPVSANTQASTANDFNIDLIDMDNFETLIQEQQQRVLAEPRHQQEDPVSQTQNAVNTNMCLHRLDVKRIFKTPEKTCETFKCFFVALKKVDSHATIRPVYVGDAN